MKLITYLLIFILLILNVFYASTSPLDRQKSSLIKRELKTADDDVSCPHAEYNEILANHIIDNDAVESVKAIKEAFYTRYSDSKFFILCVTSSLSENDETPTNVYFSATNKDYCNIVKHRIWCQVVATSN